MEHNISQYLETYFPKVLAQNIILYLGPEESCIRCFSKKSVSQCYCRKWACRDHLKHDQHSCHVARNPEFQFSRDYYFNTDCKYSEDQKIDICYGCNIVWCHQHLNEHVDFNNSKCRHCSGCEPNFRCSRIIGPLNKLSDHERHCIVKKNYYGHYCHFYSTCSSCKNYHERHCYDSY